MFKDTQIIEDHAECDTEKRNCGRTGPTSEEGRAISSKNAIKHGACSRTLILPGESEEAWQLLLSRWCQTYQPAEDSLEYDFVLKTAQAEWQRIRNQRFFDSFMCTTAGAAIFNWSPDQVKQHDLALRYKTAAERSFQREYRLLEQHYKIHRPTAAKNPTAQETAPKEAEAEEKPGVDPFPPYAFLVEDPDSPTGLTPIKEYFAAHPELDYNLRRNVPKEPRP
jgi:hypothetical protein